MAGIPVDPKLTEDALKALEIVRKQEPDGSFTFSNDVAALMLEAFYRMGEKHGFDRGVSKR